MPTRAPLIATTAAALLGCCFAAVSTNDFMQHLDRQVHAIHCSFIPGAGKEMGETGCKAVMMSPYSSYLRENERAVNRMHLAIEVLHEVVGADRGEAAA